MVTGNQIRIARFALRWSVQDLSGKTNVPLRTLKRIEASDGVPGSNAATVQVITHCLEAAGIEFVGAPNDAPGIRIHAQGGDRDKER